MSELKYLLDFINNDLLANKELSEEVNANTNLIHSGIIDSLSLVKLVSFIEKHHNIKIDDWNVSPENFQTVSAINEFINQKS